MDEKLLSARPFVGLRSCNERVHRAVHPLHSKCSFLSSLWRHFYKNHLFLTRHRRGWRVLQHQMCLKDVCSNKYTDEVNKWANICLYLYLIPQLFISALCLQIPNWWKLRWMVLTSADWSDVWSQSEDSELTRTSDLFPETSRPSKQKLELM